MARFSLGGEDDGEGPSSHRPKKQRITRTIQQTEEQRYSYNDEQIDEDLIAEEEQLDSEYSEDAEEEEEEEGELVFENQEGEEEDDEGHQSEDRGRTNEGQVSKDDGKGKGMNRDLAGSSGDGSISLIITDPDVLDCPICLEPLSIPVYQCENGHLACASCCIKIRNKCASCSWPIGYNRCRAIEKVLESIKVSCQNMKHGCKLTMSYNEKHVHEETCSYAPCSCPLPGCDFFGSSKQLYLHFSNKHSNSARHFYFGNLFPISLEMNQKYQILQEKSEGVIFILNHGIDRLGNVVNVICVGAAWSKKGFQYDIKARNGDSSVRLRSATESMPWWSEHSPVKGFLLVPNDFIGSCKQLKLEICICK